MRRVEPDVVIVGSGIAGGALATVLATAGMQVMTLERQPEFGDHVRPRDDRREEVERDDQKQGTDSCVRDEHSRNCLEPRVLFQAPGGAPYSEAAPYA